MTTQTEPNYVDYVKEHIQSDIEINKRLSGRDYSAELGTILLQYLTQDFSQNEMVMFGAIGVGELENMLRQETGKPVIFHETKKSGIAVCKLNEANDQAGLEQLHQYAMRLILGVKTQ